VRIAIAYASRVAILIFILVAKTLGVFFLAKILGLEIYADQPEGKTEKCPLRFP
jgi:hypothetical protein